MTLNYSKKLLAGALALALVAGLSSTAFAQTPDLAVDVVSDLNYDPLSASVAVGFDVPIDMICGAQDEDCVVNGEDEFLEFDCGTGSCWMTVTDCCIIADFYEVFDGGVSKGLTPDPAPDNEVQSTGDFCFSAGQHIATIKDRVTETGILYPAGLTVVITQHETDECPANVVAGELLSLDSSALVVAGLASSAVWMIPAIAGIAGAGVYLVKLRASRD